MYKIIYLIPLIIILLLSSCSTSDGHRRGSLKDAMKKSSDNYKGERNVEPDPSNNHGNHEEDNQTVITLGNLFGSNDDNSDDTVKYKGTGTHRVEYYSGNKENVSYRKSNDSILSANLSNASFSLGLSSGTGLGNFDGKRTMNNYRISCDLYSDDKTNEDLLPQLILGTSSVFVEYDNDTTGIGNSVDGTMTLLYGGLAIKKYLTPRHTFFDFYLSGGVNFSYLIWDYRNTILADGTKISDDGVGGVDFNVNAGVNLFKTSWFKLGTELNTGIYLWSEVTNEEFTNDLFRASPYARLSLVLSFDKR